MEQYERFANVASSHYVNYQTLLVVLLLSSFISNLREERVSTAVNFLSQGTLGLHMPEAPQGEWSEIQLKGIDYFLRETETCDQSNKISQ